MMIFDLASKIAFRSKIPAVKRPGTVIKNTNLGIVSIIYDLNVAVSWLSLFFVTIWELHYLRLSYVLLC